MIELSVMKPTAISYILLFIGFAIIYYITPRKAKKLWLLAGCFVFIGFCDYRFAVLAAEAAVVTWLAGRLIEAIGSKLGKAAVLALHVLLMIASLGVFRYFAGENCYFETEINEGIVIPMGLMVYTLKAISYTAGIYRGELSGKTNPISAMAYLLFFPTLVVGPIDEPAQLIEQINKPAGMDFERMKKGFTVLLWGFAVKLVLADNLGIFMDKVTVEEPDYGIPFTALTAVIMAIRIYTEFYGLSAIAAGYSGLLGFDVADNFTAPFLAPSMTEFRRSWNSSLNSWMEKNIWTSITPERKNPIINGFCLLVIVALMGAWYGGNKYVICGALGLGLYEIFENLTYGNLINKTGIGKSRARVLLDIPVWIIRTAAVFFCSMLFCFDTTGLLLNASGMKFRFWKISEEFGFDMRFWVVMGIGLALLLAVDVFKRKGISLSSFFAERIFVIRWCVYLVLAFIVAVFGCWGAGIDMPQSLCDFIY